MRAGREEAFPITLDPVAFSRKPKGRDVAGVTRRMQGAGASLVTAAEFVEHVRAGKTWCGGIFSPRKDGWGEFQGQRIFALDFDNGSHEKPLHEGDEGFLHPWHALSRCDELGIAPLCLYFSFSSVCTGDDATNIYRYRLVIDVGEVLEGPDAKDLIERLLATFPEADTACRNANRLWFGSCGEVWGGVTPWAT